MAVRLRFHSLGTLALHMVAPPNKPIGASLAKVKAFTGRISTRTSASRASSQADAQAKRRRRCGGGLNVARLANPDWTRRRGPRSRRAPQNARNDDRLVIERVIEVAGQCADVQAPEARNIGLGVGRTGSRQDSEDLHCRFKFGREEVLIVFNAIEVP